MDSNRKTSLPKAEPVPSTLMLYGRMAASLLLSSCLALALSSWAVDRALPQEAESIQTPDEEVAKAFLDICTTNLVGFQVARTMENHDKAVMDSIQFGQVLMETEKIMTTSPNLIWLKQMDSTVVTCSRIMAQMMMRKKG